MILFKGTVHTEIHQPGPRDTGSFNTGFAIKLMGASSVVSHAETGTRSF